MPPNVFPFEADGLAAKYAVLSEADFHRLNGPETRSVAVWARFAQPSRLVWARDAAAGEGAATAVARAAPTLLGAAIERAGRFDDALDLWRRAFALTYSAELRAERKGAADRWSTPTPTDTAPLPRPHWRWPCPGRADGPGGGIEGKALSVARLAKASATYAGGVDYIVWKINRHAGTTIAVKPWQRRHPLLAAVSLLPRLLRSGAIR